MSQATSLLERPVAPQARQAGPAVAPKPAPAAGKARAQLRQLIVGLVALPLTALPFLAYLHLTPEGRLVRDRIVVTLAPPSLPTLSPQERAAAVAAAPHYEGAVMALAYHGIGSASDGEGGFVISPKQFGEHLATLKAAGMHAVTATQVAEAFTGGKPLPPNAVMVSFDDGRSDAMMFADPLLAQAGMSATMFLIADAASKPGVYYASWDRVESYARSGRWDIQSHTAALHREHKAAGGASLPALTSLAPGESLAEYEARIGEDLQKASAAVEQHVGRRPMAFAYPFGAYGADRSNDAAIAGVLRDKVARHYTVAFHQDEQESVPLLTAGQNLLGLRRLEVQNWSGLELLERIKRARQLAEPGAQPTTAPDAAAAPVVAPQAPAGPANPSLTTSTSTTGAPARTVSRRSGAGSTVPVLTPPPAGAAPTAPTAPSGTVAPPASAPAGTPCKPAGKSGKCVGGTR